MSRPVARVLWFAAASTSLLAANLSLPNPSLTPGAASRVPLERLCRKGYTKSVRHVSGRTKASVYAEYGIPKSRHSAYEVDHLIPLELGGSNDIRNLWPQPYQGEWNAHTKDALEDRLHELVCRSNPPIGLSAAQQEIRTDWIAAYRATFKTDVPLK